MESPAKTFSGVLPFDVLDEIFDLISGEESLQEISILCLRWRYRSQHELFAAVQVDPMLSHGVCQVASPLHNHLAPHIKRVQLTNISKATPDPQNPFQCSTQCVDLLQALPALESIDFCHPYLDWAHVPADMLKKFVEIFSRASFRTLEVSGGNNFPIILFLHRTNVDTLELMDTKSLVFPLYAELPSPFETRLTNLRLLDTRTITVFATSLRNNTVLGQAFCQNLTHLSLKYVECCTFPALNPSTMAEICRVVGTSLESLELEATWPLGEPARPLDFCALVQLRQLHLRFAVLFPCKPQDQEIFINKYIIEVIKKLPKPRNLVEFSLDLTYYVQGFPTIDDCAQPFEILQDLLDPVFIDASWAVLKKMRVSFQLSRAAGSHSPDEIQAVDNPFPILATREIQIEAFTRA